ncbi:hypothetical protein QP027_02550 [Corynebacterium breve]|uniref:TIGR02569 family protein n=1 Tax=Corynebacterium breve TaxID=3049799 RepID=A0ABY8VH76_9CORY|nr:hypothetical protein [Corynebacterium breve]WIM68301.1 hypothetical protein QP027_02550 [Corynebacterium breve]
MIPDHVLSAFQADNDTPQALGPAWDNGLLVGKTVVAHASETAVWSAKLRDKINIEGVRVSRPVRTTDGRFVVGGYKANDFIEGETARRVDEAIAAALRLDDALAVVEQPETKREDRWAKAENFAWEGIDIPGHRQVCHADFLACVVFSGTMPPALTDIVPTAAPRPHGYSAALTAVDGLLAGAIDGAVIDRWAHVPHFVPLCERALAYREALQEPADSNAMASFGEVRALLMS